MIKKLNKGEIGYVFFRDESKCPHIASDLFELWVDENNFLHNEPGLPSYIEYYDKENRNIKIKRCYIHGIKHNLFGPNDVYYYENGDVFDVTYVLYRKTRTKKEWLELRDIVLNRLKILEEL